MLADLVPWAEPNTQALQREGVEAAVLRALGSPAPANGGPMLRYADGTPPVPLLDALLNPPPPRTPFTCDVDGTTATEQHILWIPCGASVVQLTVRGFVRDILDCATNRTLVWL